MALARGSKYFFYNWLFVTTFFFIIVLKFTQYQ